MIEKIDLTAANEYGPLRVLQEKINEIVDLVNYMDSYLGAENPAWVDYKDSSVWP